MHGVGVGDDVDFQARVFLEIFAHVSDWPASWLEQENSFHFDSTSRAGIAEERRNGREGIKGKSQEETNGRKRVYITSHDNISYQVKWKAIEAK